MLWCVNTKINSCWCIICAILLFAQEDSFISTATLEKQGKKILFFIHYLLLFYSLMNGYSGTLVILTNTYIISPIRSFSYILTLWSLIRMSEILTKIFIFFVSKKIIRNSYILSEFSSAICWISDILILLSECKK